jgi:hypothetical protein
MKFSNRTEREAQMGKHDQSRAPISQQPFTVEKPADTTMIGGTVSVK